MRNIQRDRAKRQKRLERLHQKASWYWSNRETLLRELEAQRTERKVDGKCRQCPSRSLEDNTLCARCLRKERRRNRLRMRRVREEERQAQEQRDAAYQPIDEVIDLTRVRVLRGARYLDWFQAHELLVELGYANDTDRNTMTAMLCRLAKAGLFERRDAAGSMRYTAAEYDYRMTQAGRDDLDAIIGGKKRLRTHRRAA